MISSHFIMHILFEHGSVLPVQRYGGTERVLYWLMGELVRQGHRVSLVGDPRSDVASIGAQLIPRPEGDWKENLPDEVFRSVDVVHLFQSPGKWEREVPLLVTIEGNGQPGETFHPNSIFVSRKHAENHGASAFVYNGIDLREYPFVDRPRGSWKQFAFLAKAKWKVKNLADCVRVCRENRKHLQVAGGRAWVLSPWIHSWGMVDQSQKQKLLAKTDALLFPVRWHEPFGIAIVEAMAAGLPVLGSPHGSLPELIPPEAGAICKNYQELSQWVGRSENPFNGATLRKYVESRFTVEQMARAYVELYTRVRDGEMIHSTPPRTRDGWLAQELLSF